MYTFSYILRKSYWPQVSQNLNAISRITVIKSKAAIFFLTYTRYCKRVKHFIPFLFIMDAISGEGEGSGADPRGEE